MRSLIKAALASGLAILASPAPGEAGTGELFYSIDNDADVLVLIDASTGGVTVVGPLGRDVAGIDLAVADGQLYATDTYFANQRAELLRINTSTGAATYLGDLFRGADRVTHAEGLTASQGQLLVSFTTTSNSTFSVHLGDLALDGTISNDTVEGPDMDGLGTDSSGQVYALDVVPPDNRNVLHTVQPTAEIGWYSRSEGSVADVDFGQASLYGIAADQVELHRIDPLNGQLLESIPLDRPGLYTGIARAQGSPSETICPDAPDDYFRLFGGSVTGDALDLCASDDVRLEVVQSARLSPLLPFIRLEFWAHSTLADDAITSVEYTVEGHVSALVAGGQNPDTLRTSIRNYSTGQFEIVDQRGTGANADETINHVQTANAPDYVNAGDGEVRVRQDVFDPGNVFTPNWFLKVDLYEVVISK